MTTACDLTMIPAAPGTIAIVGLDDGNPWPLSVACVIGWAWGPDDVAEAVIAWATDDDPRNECGRVAVCHPDPVVVFGSVVGATRLARMVQAEDAAARALHDNPGHHVHRFALALAVDGLTMPDARAGCCDGIACPVCDARGLT